MGKQLSNCNKEEFISLDPFGAPKGRRAKCQLSPLSAFFASEYET